MKHGRQPRRDVCRVVFLRVKKSLIISISDR